MAAAYWLTFLALEHLYPDSLPQRGGIRVEMREDARCGTTGVVATIVQMLTGAAGGTGFKGIGGRFARVNLIRYTPDLLLTMRFIRQDKRAAVDVHADVALAPSHPQTEQLLEKCLAEKASPQEQLLLGELWQLRVRHLLLDSARDPAVFVVRPAEKRMPHRTLEVA
ncbi:MAG TPA: hypothetical protein VJN68_11665 [Burkholderiaceae bacterium]|nr:hypothetical protein [Burkholderiaceae bacterium]